MKNTVLLILLIPIIFSCKDDEADMLFPNGSRELTIEFSEFNIAAEHFCIVSDEGGRSWWDTIYRDNRGTSHVVVPVDRRIDITVGHKNLDRFFIETYHDVKDQFEVTTSFHSLYCRDFNRLFTSLAKREITITGVQSPVELAQSGLEGVGDQQYNSALDEFKVTVYPLAINDVRDFHSTLIAVRDLPTGEVRGMLVHDSVWINDNPIILGYAQFSELETHFIESDQSASWYLDLNALKDGKRIYLNSSGSFVVNGQSTNQIAFYLPKDFDADVFEAQIMSSSLSSFNEVQGAVLTQSTLPMSINFFEMELTDKGTKTDCMAFQLNGAVDYSQSLIGYEDFSFWRVHQLGGMETNIHRTEFPRSVQLAFPQLMSSISKVKKLEVVMFRMDDPVLLPAMFSTENGDAINCLPHQHVKMIKNIE